MTDNEERTRGCDACPLATDRREFLRNMAVAVGATLVGTAFSPGSALVRNVRVLVPLARTGARARYELPDADGVSIDDANEVILARWQGEIHAFSSRCTHRGAQLQWHADESRVFCPKHKARFRADGVHDSGRSTRALDRYDLRLEGSAVVVELDLLHRADEDPAGWSAAVIRLA